MTSWCDGCLISPSADPLPLFPACDHMVSLLTWSHFMYKGAPRREQAMGGLGWWGLLRASIAATYSRYTVFHTLSTNERNTNYYWTTAPSAVTCLVLFCSLSLSDWVVFMERKNKTFRCVDWSSDCVVPLTELQHNWMDITHDSRLFELEELLLWQIHKPLFRIHHKFPPGFFTTSKSF